jgi:hypothetical protein
MPDLTTYEALDRVAHRVANSETERTDLQAAFLKGFGNDEEKKRFYTESDADRQKREAQEKFDLAVAAEVRRRQETASEQAAVNAAADVAGASPGYPAYPGVPGSGYPASVTAASKAAAIASATTRVANANSALALSPTDPSALAEKAAADRAFVDANALVVNA